MEAAPVGLATRTDGLNIHGRCLSVYAEEQAPAAHPGASQVMRTLERF
jgi:hypothetical protein